MKAASILDIIMSFPFDQILNLSWAAEAKNYWGVGGTMENVKVRYYRILFSFLPFVSHKLTLER